jgi:Recombination endonuclease VII
VSVTGGVCADGRCFRCVQRRRYYPDVPLVWVGDVPRHLIYEGNPLCWVGRRPRSKRPEKMREYRRQYDARKRAEDPEAWQDRRRRKDRRWRHGLTDAEWEDLVAQQDGLCAICREGPAANLDHNHRTGQRRALLCNRCNLGLGYFDDDPRRLALAMLYLLAYQEEVSA